MAYLGWPFLIGRGRRTGHRVLLAPDFLVATDEHGVLEGISGDNVMRLGLLTVRSATHQVGAADVAGTERPRDEHGRPLRLIYGVVASGVEPANADLPTALAAALATYRRFLRGEEQFTVESSQGFPLTAQPSTVDRPAPRPAVAPQPPRPDRARIAVLSSAAALVAVLAVGSTLLLGRSAEQPSPPPLCPTTTVAPTTVAPTTTGVPTTTAPAVKVAPTPSVSVPPAPAPRC